jgi:hypothetical protein
MAAGVEQSVSDTSQTTACEITSLLENESTKDKRDLLENESVKNCASEAFSSEIAETAAITDSVQSALTEEEELTVNSLLEDIPVGSEVKLVVVPEDMSDEEAIQLALLDTGDEEVTKLTMEEGKREGSSSNTGEAHISTHNAASTSTGEAHSTVPESSSQSTGKKISSSHTDEAHSTIPQSSSESANELISSAHATAMSMASAKAAPGKEIGSQAAATLSSSSSHPKPPRRLVSPQQCAEFGLNLNQPEGGKVKIIKYNKII